MNRKLRNTILAFSVTGMVLAVGLIAARPVFSGPPAPTPQVATVTPAAHGAPRISLAGLDGSGAATLLTDVDAVSARVQARSRQYEAALVDVQSMRQAVALTVDFLATVVGESVLAEPVDPDEAGTAAVDDAPPASQARRSRSVRSAIAVPYFSFARGTGQGRS